MMGDNVKRMEQDRRRIAKKQLRGTCVRPIRNIYRFLQNATQYTHNVLTLMRLMAQSGSQYDNNSVLNYCRTELLSN